MSALLVSLAAAAATTAASDTPRDYSHMIPLEISGRPSVVQLQLPRDVYLNARSSALSDLRIFDANGVVQPFALRQPQAETQTSHLELATRVFPLMADVADGELAGLEVSTGSDGRLVSVRLPAGRDAAHPRRQLAALVLDLRQEGKEQPPLVDALRFRLPAGRTTYSGQVWLEASDDLKSWATVGVAELSWLANASDETLASDRIEFGARRMRYARLRWHSGEPLQFASVTAESPVQTDAPSASESLLLPPQPGRVATDLQYTKPPGVPVARFGLQLEGTNAVLPVTLGRYYQRQSQRQSERTAFEPALRATFYRLERDGKPYASDDIAAPPITGDSWVLRFQQPPVPRPSMRISWQPATVVFVAGGTPPYALAIGRDRAPYAARDISEVAPGFSESELRSLQRAQPGALRAQSDVIAAAAQRASADAAGATQRLALLWAVLLAGVGVVAFMIWRLLRQQSNVAK